MKKTLCYRYSKQENLTIDNPEMLQFTHLLMEAKSKYSPKIRSYLKTHNIIDSVDAFSHIAFNYNMLPPIKVKTKPSIFIMKRKSNITYDPHKAKSSISELIKNSPKQIDNIENVEFNMSDEVKTVDSIHNIVKSREKFEIPENISEQNLLDKVDEMEEIINNIEKNEIFNNLVNDSATSMEDTTWKIDDTNKLSPSKEKLIKKEKNVDFQENFENVPNIYDAKVDEKTNIEEEKIIKKELKNNLNMRQENHGTKQTIRKIIQKQMREDKQKVNESKEINIEPKNTELPIKLMKKETIVESPRRKILQKQEAKDVRTSTINESTLTDQDQIKVVKEDAKEDKQRFKTKDTTQKTGKIKIIKPVNLEQIVENEDLNKEKTIDVTVKKITKTQNNIDTELPAVVTERQMIKRENEKDIKSSNSINVRESIKNIINQFKEFEKDFIYDNIDSVNDVTHANHIESDLHITEMDNSMDHSAKSKDQVVVKDARESFKEILDQFKYIKDELTSEEDDQFDEIAAKYMEQPIAETLLQFSEALKTLMQRRKKTVSDLYDKQNADVSDMER